jgi:hypothetical protein
MICVDFLLQLCQGLYMPIKNLLEVIAFKFLGPGLLAV